MVQTETQRGKIPLMINVIYGVNKHWSDDPRRNCPARVCVRAGVRACSYDETEEEEEEEEEEDICFVWLSPVTSNDL